MRGKQQNDRDVWCDRHARTRRARAWRGAHL